MPTEQAIEFAVNILEGRLQLAKNDMHIKFSNETTERMMLQIAQLEEVIAFLKSTKR